MWFKYPLKRPGYHLERGNPSRDSFLLDSQWDDSKWWLFCTMANNRFLTIASHLPDEISWIPRWSHGPKTKNGWPLHQPSGKVAPRFLLLRWWCCWLLSMFDIQQFQGLRLQVKEVCVSKMMYPQKSRRTSLTVNGETIGFLRPGQKKLQALPWFMIFT